MKHFLFLIFLIFVCYFSPLPIFAADLNVVCDGSSCSSSGQEPLFSLASDGYWYPGRYLTKTINVGNSSSGSQIMSLQANRSLLSVVNPSLLENANIINISLVDPGTSLIWSGDLSDFYSAGEIDFGLFTPGTAANYSLTVSMNTSADNDYQDKEAKFDLTLGFTTDSLPSDGDDNGTDGTVAGASAPVCHDAVPATPTGLSYTIVGPTQVRLDWTHVPAPFTSYLIAFGPQLGDYRWGNPNVGSDNFYTITSLTPGARYCFYVRAQNGCMPGEASIPVCLNPGSTIPISEVPPGFEEGVLGEQVEVTPSPAFPVELGQIEGTQTCSRRWLPLLYLFALLINLVYYYDHHNHLITLILPILAYFIDKFFLNNSCCLVTTVYCQYYWIGNLLSWLIPLYYYRRQSK